MKEKKYLVHLSGVVAMIFWGLSFIWSTQVFNYLNPTTTIFFRLIISTIFLGSLLLLFGMFEKIEKKDLKLFALAALFEPFLYFIFESYGLLNASPVVSSAVIATIPLFTPIAAFFFLNERLTSWNIVGFIISFFGVIFMLLNKNLELTVSLKGVIFLFSAVIVAVAYSISLRKLTLLYKPLTITFVQNVIGMIYFIPMFFVMERVTPSDIMSIGNYIVPLLSLGVFASSVAYTLWAYAFSKLGAAKANIYSNLIPVFTAIFSCIIIGENISIQKILGILLVIGGLILSQLKSNKI
ncbi:MAG: DMT family transporter [Bacteroidales bacterium]|nr:DMT family transporter [Lentimicrobiaceae bacterium]MBQ2853373.1 DMT family transporter [Bacteroidales bacterium]